MNRAEGTTGPGLLIAAITLAALGCDAPPSLMVVELRTNLLPGRDFTGAYLTVTPSDPTLEPIERMRVVHPSERYGDAEIRLAELEALPAGNYELHAELIDDAGAFVAEGLELAQFFGRTEALAVRISFGCRGVMCTGDFICHGDRCVDQRCLPGSPPSDADCPEPLCTDASECPPTVACARPTCTDGVCFPEPDDRRCPDGQYCHIEDGCVSLDLADAGVDPGGDAGCTDREQCNDADDDCDGVVDEGFDLESDPLNCGRCRSVCSAGGPDDLVQCRAGECVLECAPGRADCNGDPRDGCEAILSAPETCGSCAVQCAAPTPLCVATGMGAPRCDSRCGTATMCGASCVDTLTDEQHCGTCGTVCSDGEMCVAGACRCGGTGPDCGGMPDSVCCAGACVDTRTDRDNCASCRSQCDSGESCGSGECRCGGTGPDCLGVPGSVCCGTSCADTRTSATHCGACGVPCARAHATATCSAGACTLGACDPGWSNCDGNAANGCETNTATDLANCGGCGAPCGPFPEAVASCSGGSCSIASCVATRRNCDGMITNGCETEVWGNDDHCGGCDNACAGGLYCNTTICCMPFSLNCDGVAGNGCECSSPNAFPGCAGSTCGIGPCFTGFADCDGTAVTGCETTPATSTAHCGGCGRNCATLFPTFWVGARYDRCAGGTCQCGSGPACTSSGDSRNSLCCPTSGAPVCHTGIDRHEDHCGGCNVACGANEECGIGTPPAGGTAGRCCCGTNCGAASGGQFCPAGRTCNATTGACE